MDLTPSLPPAVRPLGVIDYLRHLYWGIRRNPRTARHILGAAIGAAVLGFRLSRTIRGKAKGRPVMAIAQIQSMGDAIAAEPIARLARQLHPGAWICWITTDLCAPLVRTFPQIDHCVTARCLTEWLFLCRLHAFSVIWDLHHRDQMCLTCNILVHKPATPANQANYLLRGNLLDMFCDNAGLPRYDAQPKLEPHPAAAARIDALALPAAFIVIHAVSSHRQKDWPLHKWRDLSAAVQASTPIPFIEVGSHPAVFIQNNLLQRSLCGELSLPETVELIRRARLFVGVDSGPAHIANAVNTPGVILLGRFASFPRYMPFSGAYASGANASIVYSDTEVADLTMAEVLAPVLARLASR